MINKELPPPTTTRAHGTTHVGRSAISQYKKTWENDKSNSHKHRIVYIDVLRGLAILLVIYSHSLVLLTSDVNLSELNGLFMKFRMPLFFFISGYFVYNFNYTSELLKQRTLNRINRQLFTTIIFWISYCILFVCRDLESFIRLPFVSDKNGYWFTFVSVELFFMFAPVLWLFYKYKFSRQRQTLCLLLLVVMFAVVYGISRYFPLVYHKGAFFSIYHVLKYGIYFVLGLLYKLNESGIKQAITNIYSCLFYLTLSISILLFNPIHAFIIDETLVAGLLIAFIFSAASNVYKSRIVNNSYFTTFMVYIGQMTLEIYLLHYFVIAILKTTDIGYYLEPHINAWSEFPVFLSISLVILSACIGFVFILKKLNLYNPIFRASFLR